VDLAVLLDRSNLAEAQVYLAILDLAARIADGLDIVEYPVIVDFKVQLEFKDQPDRWQLVQPVLSKPVQLVLLV
jgi:hypothetical protein